MTRRAEQIPLDDDWVLTKVWHKRQSGAAILAAVQAVPPDTAFIPALAAGPAFDSPEGWKPNVMYRVTSDLDGLHVEEVPETAWRQPPNCTEPMSGYAEESPGAYLAQAQHEAAIDGDGCESGACLLTRGSD